MNNEIFDTAEEFIKGFRSDLKNLRENSIEELLSTELNNGYWGATAKKIFSELTEDERYIILRALKLQEQTEGRRLKFLLAFKNLFPVSEVYRYNGRFLLCLPEEKSEAALKKIELIKILFLEVGNVELEIYFGEHFGVFGSPQTMRLDEMILY